jgi:DNA-binding response OmpR family regulator
MLCDVNDKPTLLRILEMGVSDVITRPIDLEELRWRIEAVRRWSTTSKS